MDRRIIICSTNQLPRGNANSNYIFNMAKSLKEYADEVISIGASNQDHRIDEVIEGVRCINISFYKKHIPMIFKGNFSFGLPMINELKKLKITPNDYIIIYDGYALQLRQLDSFFKFMPKGHIVTCVVEWPMKNQYSLAPINPKYIEWLRIFNKWMPNWGKIIPISRNLENHFIKAGCETFILPPMIDSSDYQICESKKVNEVCDFIYSGVFSQKDAMENMILSVEKLTDEERKKFRFHITGNSMQTLESFLGDKKYVLKKYSDNIIVHGRLPYDELLELYANTDYLLLARPENQYTISNFPSKVPEMMNYGIVPVCSNVGDYTNLYLTDGEDSIIFDGCSVDDCANAIKRALSLTSEQRQQMKLNAKNNSAKMFDFRVWGEKLAKFIFE